MRWLQMIVLMVGCAEEDPRPAACAAAMVQVNRCDTEAIEAGLLDGDPADLPDPFAFCSDVEQGEGFWECEARAAEQGDCGTEEGLADVMAARQVCADLAAP